jgi:glucose/arabinose dehydrogenase
MNHDMFEPMMARRAGRVAATLAVTGLAMTVGCGQNDPANAVNAASPAQENTGARRVLTGENALGDWTTDAPGVRRLITTRDMPRPYATPSVDNGPRMVPRPEGARPKVPVGFKVDEFATGLNNPRNIITAPNGDLFVAESNRNRVRLLRDADGDGKPEVNTIFAENLTLPFGLAFYPNGANPQYLYVANTDSVVRIPYKSGDTTASGAPTTIVPDIPGGGRLRGGGHWTRDVKFSPDNKKMYVSVGSMTNVHENPQANEERRAAILEYNPDGTGGRTFASGIRNAVGLAFNPVTRELWCSVNERDGLGDHLPPEYITHVQEGGFYGWPWYYIGPNQDPRHEGKHPELKDKVIVPDVLVQSHSASLGMTFYTGRQFPAEYRNEAFAAEHGSWNRARRTGYKVIRVPMRNGKATGEYEDFMTGFVTTEGDVWGRPVGVTVGKDGSLFVSDDGSGTVWRISHTGNKPASR